MSWTRPGPRPDGAEPDLSREPPLPREAEETTPEPADHSGLLDLQRTAGNAAVARMLSGAARAPTSARVRPGTARGLLQRVLEDHPGPEIGGKAMVKGMGLKELLRETDDEKLYFKSARSSATDWILIEVKLSSDGRNYEKTGAERSVKAQKKVPQTCGDWRTLAYISGSTMLYPAQRYPHVTIDLKSPARDPGDKIEFETMHYSRSNDDPYRSGYKLISGGWKPVNPNDRKDKQKECDDAVDEFLETVGVATRVIRA